MAQQLKQARREPGWVSRDDRMAVVFDGMATREDGSTMAVTLFDMSRDGCRIECVGTTLCIGEWVELDAPGCGSTRAQVRWALLGSAGLRFADL